MQPQHQVFSLSDLTGDDIQAIMNALNELPAKQSRMVMNKVEGQIIEQLRKEQERAVEAPKESSASKAD